VAIEPVRQGTVSSEISTLAASLLARERTPIQTLQTRQNELNQRTSVLSTLKTRLIALQTELDSLAGTGTLSPFAANAVTSSDAHVLTASATAGAATGTLSVTVSQLAKRSTHATHRYADSGTVISAAGTGVFAFGLTMAGTTYNVTVSIGVGDTDKTVLDNLAGAITSAVSGKASAVRVATESGMSRLSLSSAETGTGNKLSFTDTGGLLARIGIVNPSPTAATATTGGYIYEDLANHELDATLIVDGLTYYRATNTVTDLVAGVTLNLKSTSLSALTVKIQPDVDKAVAKIKDFILKYNDVLDYLVQQTATDPKAHTRAPLAGDPVFGSLAGQLRARAATRVTSQPAGTPDSLAALGLTSDRSGKLSVKDETALRDTFITNPAAVASLFNQATVGVAATLKTFVDGYAKATGQITATQNQISVRVNGLKTQIDRMNEALARKQVRLEEQLARNQALLTKLSRQSGQIANILGALA
jgi:flagellar hook-associated protein 2